jgi:DNA-binding response OmpR family regulator
MQTILVIDDDESLRDTIGVMLEQEGFRAVLVADGRAGYEKSLLLKPDLILVDLRLPGMSGVEICKQVRAAHVVTPIIVLSALGDEIDKVLLLEIGADDYLVKPFGTRELLARIRAVPRRTSPEARKVVHFSEVGVDLERRVVTRRGEEVKLTPAEYNLLTYFLAEPRPAAHARHDSQFGLGLRVLPQHPHGGRPRRQAAPEAGAGAQRAPAFPDRAWGGLPLPAVNAGETTDTADTSGFA